MLYGTNTFVTVPDANVTGNSMPCTTAPCGVVCEVSLAAPAEAPGGYVILIPDHGLVGFASLVLTTHPLIERVAAFWSCCTCPGKPLL